MSQSAPLLPDGPSAATDPLRALIGAALLAAGRPLRAAELAPLLRLSERQTRARLGDYAAALAAAGLGFEVEEVAGGYRLAVLPGLA